ncbi:MAG: hypothetical protein J6A74_01250, partial [Oscillospiraceae bacterium]|nr:hypothetical protein [Oscillospiraceae bacterium]
MLRTLVRLPDGTELFSGTGNRNAIQSITVTQCVNSGTDLTLGSCCANMVELKLFTPGGGVCIHAGDELEIYRLSDAGERYKVGIFTAEKPTRPTANSLQVTAYDRVTRLDKDLTQWFAGLDAWPYTLFDLASMTCEACGLVLKNTEIPSGGYPVRQFSPDGITGRQLMQWIGEAAGRFCRATADGDLEFTWYTPAEGVAIATTKAAEEIVYSNGALHLMAEDVVAEDDGEGNVILISDRLSISDDGAGNVSLLLEKAAEQIPFFQNGLTFEDFEVAPIEKVQIRQNEEDVGTVYPDGIPDAVNTYIITGNPLLSAVTGDELTPVAEVLFELLQGVRYTPCKVAVPASFRIHAGNTVEITDRNGRTITAYVMTKVQKGQKDTLECTGSSSRDSTTTFNNRQLASLQGKVLNLRMDVDGLRLENTDQAGKLTLVEADLQGIRGQVSAQTAQMNEVQTQMTQVSQTAQSLQITVDKIQSDGVNKIKTQMGYTFDDAGLQIAREGQQMKNLLDNTG